MQPDKYNYGLTLTTVIATVVVLTASALGGYLIYATVFSDVDTTTTNEVDRDFFSSEASSESTTSSSEVDKLVREGLSSKAGLQVSLQRGATKPITGDKTITYRSPMTDGSHMVIISYATPTCQPGQLFVSESGVSTAVCQYTKYSVELKEHYPDSEIIILSVKATTTDPVSGSQSDDVFGSPAIDNGNTDFQSLMTGADSSLRWSSTARGAETQIIDDLTFTYTELVDSDSHRVRVNSDTRVCSPQEFVVNAGETHFVTCGEQEYQFEFSSYDEESDAISYSASRVLDDEMQPTSTQPTSTNDITNAGAQATSSINNECTTIDCLNSHLTNCQPATTPKAVEGVGVLAFYEILGNSDTGQCRVSVAYSQHPNSDWENRFFTCDFNTDVTINKALNQALESALTDNEANCEGPLYEEVLSTY